MSAIENEIKEVELSIETAKEYLELFEEASKLPDNKSFKLVIMEGYFKEEAARLAGMLADPSMMDETNQRELMSMLKAIGHLKQYLLGIDKTGKMFKASLEGSEELLDELRSEA